MTAATLVHDRPGGHAVQLTPRQQQLDRALDKLGETTLGEYLEERRELRRYWHEIATELEELVGWSPHPEVLRRWGHELGVANPEEVAA